MTDANTSSSLGDKSPGENISNPGRTFSYRRLCFAVIVMAIMSVAAGGAMLAGYLLVHKDPSDAALGTVALIVSPALTLIGTLSTILANLLREEQ